MAALAEGATTKNAGGKLSAIVATCPYEVDCAKADTEKRQSRPNSGRSVTEHTNFFKNGLDTTAIDTALT